MSTTAPAICVIALALSLGGAALAQDAPPPSPGERDYSPYPEQNFPNQVLFGDTHLHTAFSADAGLVGATLTPDDAYRFARGEEVVSSTGVPARLARPLDFLVVTDHAENLGLPVAMAERSPVLMATDWGQEIVATTAPGTTESMIAGYELWMARINAVDDPLDGTDFARTMWERVTQAAEAHNVPGAFSAMIGFEWTLTPDGNNLHRNVIFRDGKDKADQIVPLSAYDTQDPLRLWDWLEMYERTTGGRVLAIPHNGNLSNGLMFDDVTLVERTPIDRDYALRRMRWEPVYEVTQIKGDGEAHPLLSPEDEFADFETWDKGSFGPEPKTPEMLPKEYAREAYKRGLAYEAKLDANPFKFGLVGSTDAHTGLSTTTEDNFFGKVTVVEPTADPIRFYEAITGRFGGEELRQYHWQGSAAGLAGVWARENTREAIWDAMARKEVFATTGTRLRVRVFAGWKFTAEDLDRSDFAKHGYDNGVPMGGDLAAAPEGAAPTFLIRALRDVDGANLDRVQVVKGWLDAAAGLHEQIYDVACSDARTIDYQNRCAEPVGDTVDVENASYTNAIGDPFLQAFWTDPLFDPSEHAFYYIRVLEIPTPRWTTYDAKIFGVEIPEGAPTAIQERAYTSPIWYTPER